MMTVSRSPRITSAISTVTDRLHLVACATALPAPHVGVAVATTGTVPALREFLGRRAYINLGTHLFVSVIQDQ